MGIPSFYWHIQIPIQEILEILLWKFYLDILCRIVFDFGNSHILSVLHSGVKLDCRKFTVCTEKNCTNITKDRVTAIYYREIVTFCIRTAEVSCQNVNSLFIIDAFKNYKSGVDFFSCYLVIHEE